MSATQIMLIIILGLCFFGFLLWVVFYHVPNRGAREPVIRAPQGGLGESMITIENRASPVTLVNRAAGAGRSRGHSSSSSDDGDLLHGFPSGLWSGYYNQDGRNHALTQFRLEVTASGDLSGTGVDDVGQYTIDGKMRKRGRQMKFHKRYLVGTPASNGMLSGENAGHTVKYKGEMVGQGLHQGFRGTWKIRGVDSGAFHLWPAMPDWQRFAPPASAPALAPLGVIEAQPVPAQPVPVVFVVTDDNICTVCFDRPIDVCLLPCTHVAVCGSCAEACRHQGCPICRSRIEHIARHDGAAKALQSSAPALQPSAPPLELS